MRYILCVILAAFLFNGCDINDNQTDDGQLLYSAKKTYGNVQYMLSTPYKSIGIHDTLNVYLDVMNAGSAPESLWVSDVNENWSLKNSDGQTIMYWGRGNCSADLLIIEPNHVKNMYYINEAIADMSGKPVIPGTYTLTAYLNVFQTDPLSLSIYLK